VRAATERTAALRAEREIMAGEVWSGLNRAQKEIPSKYFYDERGSELFDEITRLPEYYLTRAECRILQRIAPELIRSTSPRTLVELGPGSGDKTRILLDQIVARSDAPVYVPVDVSETYLEQLSAEFRAAYPALVVRPSLSDITREIRLPPRLASPLIVAFLGSTIGNFEAVEAGALLARIGALLTPEDRFLIGFDLKKDPGVLHAAYNDAAGVTAEFNLNLLRVLNQALDCDFDPGAFRHRAEYLESLGRIEMHLVSTQAQAVRIDALGIVQIAEGETIRTEISCKYDRDQIETMLGAAGLELDRFDTDSAGRFALVTARRAD
jgi:L-histidine N-alpha-methyltransferase